MYLLLTEIGHLTLALLAGFICYKLYRRGVSWLLAILSGFMIDIDHYLDFLIYGGNVFDVGGFLSSTYYHGGASCYIIFHSWELAMGLGVVTIFSKKKYIFCPLFLGLVFHLIWDHMTNPAYWYTYFWIGRFLNGFDLGRIFVI